MQPPDSSRSSSSEAALPARRRVYALLFQVLAGMLLGLFVADRAIGRYDSGRDLSEEQGAHMLSESLGWTLRPGYDPGRPGSKISSIGLRSPEIPFDAPADEVRILGVGAPRIFGAGEGSPPGSEAWSPQLEQLMQGLEGDFRVLNGGVVGYSARQAARRAMMLMDVVQPDLILLFFSPGDQFMFDVSGASVSVSYEGRQVPRGLVEASPAALLPAVVATHHLLMESHLYKRWRAMRIRNDQRPEEVRGYVLSRAPAPEYALPYIEQTFEEVDALRALCEQRGCALRVVVLPESYMDSPGRWNSYKHRWLERGGPPLATPREEPLVVLHERLTRLGLQCYSLDETVVMFGRDRERYTCDGAHWSKEGHGEVAMALLMAMRRERLPAALRSARAAAPRVEHPDAIAASAATASPAETSED